MRQWYLCLPGLVWGLNRVRHVPDTLSSLNVTGGCSECHRHQYHHSSFYFFFLFHLKASSWLKRPSCYLIARQGNFSLFPFESNHVTSSRGRVIEWLKCTLESPWAGCQAGWNSSLDRPIQMHGSLPDRSLYPEASHSLPGLGSLWWQACVQLPFWPFLAFAL